MGFWIISGVVTLCLGAWFFRVLAQDPKSILAENPDIAVYRDQLAEVDRDLARGVLGDDEADRVRTEVGRRILQADRGSRVPTNGMSARMGLVGGGLVVLALIGGIFLYSDLGAPGYEDLPLETRKSEAEALREGRPSQLELESQVPPSLASEVDPRLQELVQRLRDIVADRPDDVQGLTLLARNEATLGNYSAAREAQEKLVAAKDGNLTREDLERLLDLMVVAAGGVVSPEADRVIAALLEGDPGNGMAQYYLGLMHAQTGRPDLTFNVWRQLLEQGDPMAPYMESVRGSIDALATAAGVDYTAPPAARGPSAEDIANAQDMSPEDRQAMIEGMVSGLAERLATEGGPPQDWARLISALGVLGQSERAAAIWKEAQTVFGGSDEALSVVRQGAQSAGVVE